MAANPEHALTGQLVDGSPGSPNGLNRFPARVLVVASDRRCRRAQKRVEEEVEEHRAAVPQRQQEACKALGPAGGGSFVI